MIDKTLDLADGSETMKLLKRMVGSNESCPLLSIGALP